MKEPPRSSFLKFGFSWKNDLKTHTMSHIIDTNAQVCENTELRSASFSRWKLALVVRAGGGIFFYVLFLDAKIILKCVFASLKRDKTQLH